MKKRIGIVVLAGLSASVATAQGPDPVYPLPPPGHGRNGDWANLGRYREDNQRLLAGPRPTTVFMGDSITEAWAFQPDFKKAGTRVGRGIGAQTTQQMLVRFRADVIELRPSVVHIMAGTNDIAGNNGPVSDADIEGNIASMVELAQANGIKVIIASIPPASDFRWQPGIKPSLRIQRVNAWYKAYTRQKRITYVDYGRVLADNDGGMRSDFSSDGVHPNAIAYAAMEPLTEAAIRDAKAAN